MSLSKNEIRPYYGGDVESYPIAAGVIIYIGSAVGEDANGYARPLVAGDTFLGFSDGKYDNSAGAAGAMSAEVKRRGRIELSVDSLVLADNDGAPVYASDDDTFTKVSTANSFVGYVSRFISAGVGVVDFDAALVKSA